MSQWTHIRGGLELHSDPYEIKKASKPLIEPKEEDFEKKEDYLKAWNKYGDKLSKLYYYPYPEEQFKLRSPEPDVVYGKMKSDGKREEYNSLSFEADVYSLPRARKYIGQAFDLMPQGESGFRYSLDQKSTDCSSSSSSFYYPCQQKAYQEALTKMYSIDGTESVWSYDLMKRCWHIEDYCWVNNVDGILVGIRDDIRYCSAEAVQEGLEKAFKYLEEHGIYVEDGYLEWEDEYDPDYIYSWRNSRLSSDITHQFLKINKNTNEILHSKVWVIQRDEKGHLCFDENGIFICKIVEQEGPYISKEE